MKKSSEIIPDPKDAVSYLGDTVQALMEVLTGIATSEKKDRALSVGYILQRARGGQFLSQLLEEAKKYRDKGTIKEDYFKSSQSYDCLQEVLDFIDKDSPDEVRFKAIKSLFLTIASEKQSSRADVLPSQLLKICRSLSSGELLVLLGTYETYLGNEWREERERKVQGMQHTGTTSKWIEKVLKVTGLEYPELVRLSEQSLMEKRLLSPFEYGDGSGFRYTEYYRLTSLGYKLCVFIRESDGIAA